MSIRLTLKMRGEEGGSEKAQTILLDDDVIVLGRDETCQVRLAQKAVSRNHARISRDGQLYFVEDLGSSFGTQVNGAKLPKSEKRLLRNGDTIAIAQFDVVFDRVAAAATEEEASGAGKTAFLSRKVVKDVIKGLGVGGEQPFFRIMNGKADGQRIEISDAQEYVIGREGTADIVLNDDLVSRRHVKVRRDWSGTHLEDLGSRNGFRVNRKKVTRLTLKDRDEVEIGNVKLLYIDPSEVREAPVVLPSNDEDEGTLSVREDPAEQAAAEAQEAGGDEAAEQGASDEAPAEAEASSEEASAGEGDAGESGGAEGDAEAGPQASLSDGSVENQSQENPVSGEMPSLEDPPDEADEGRGPLIDFNNKQTLVVLAIAGVVGLGVVVLVILLLAGA